MERVRIAALFADKEQYGGASVTVCGWAKTIRDMKTFGFIELNDGSCFRNLQVVMDANSLSNYKEIAAQAPQRRISAHHPASAPAHEPLLRGVPREKRGGLRRA